MLFKKINLHTISNKCPNLKKLTLHGGNQFTRTNYWELFNHECEKLVDIEIEPSNFSKKFKKAIEKKRVDR